MPAIDTPFLLGPTGEFSPQLGTNHIFVIIGQVIAPSGVTIAGATVDLFHAQTRAWIASTISGTGGSFTFNPPNNQPYFCRWVLPGSPEQFGTSGTLVPV